MRSNMGGGLVCGSDLECFGNIVLLIHGCLFLSYLLAYQMHNESVPWVGEDGFGFGIKNCESDEDLDQGPHA